MEKYNILTSDVKHFAAKYYYNSHAHRSIEVNYVLKGNCLMLINNEEVYLTKGDCLIITPNKQHNFYVNGISGCTLNQLEFDYQNDNPLINDISENLYVKLKHAESISQIINNLAMYKSDRIYISVKKTLCELDIDKLLYITKALCDSPQSKNEAYHKIFNKILFDIRSDVNHIESLESISKRYGYSSRYIRVMFTQFLGSSYIDYVTNLKVQEAKRLLVNSNNSISEIAITLGYNNIQYFSIVFKKCIGITPTIFRKINI